MNRLRTICTLGMAAWLTACGGGGGSTPYVPSTATSCSLPLQYANGSSSGLAITAQTLSTDRTLSSCNIAQLQSVKLTVCITHPTLSEVTGHLRLAGNSLFAFNATDGTAVGTSCLAQSGGATTVREFMVTSGNLPSVASITNAWSVDLSDSIPSNNQSGYFVAWALDLQGLR